MRTRYLSREQHIKLCKMLLEHNQGSAAAELERLKRLYQQGWVLRDEHFFVIARMAACKQDVDGASVLCCVCVACAAV